MRIDRTQTDHYLKLAHRLMAERGIETEDHVLLGENLACGLTHLIKPAAARRAVESPLSAWKAVQERATSERWLGKVQRDLAQPYTDGQVVQHLRNLEGQLGESMTQLLQDQVAPYPVRVFIQGSLLKGRMGANSDLDVMVETTHPDISHRAEQQYLSQSEDGVTVRPVSADRPGFNQFMRLLSGPSLGVPVGIGYTGFLIGVNQKVLAQKGIELSDDGRVRRVGSEVPDRKEVSKTFAAACEKVWTEDMSPEEKLRMVHHRSLKSMVLHTVGGTIGALSMGPLGPLVKGSIGLLVKQE